MTARPACARGPEESWIRNGTRIRSRNASDAIERRELPAGPGRAGSGAPRRLCGGIDARRRPRTTRPSDSAASDRAERDDGRFRRCGSRLRRAAREPRAHPERHADRGLPGHERPGRRRGPSTSAPRPRAGVAGGARGDPDPSARPAPGLPCPQEQRRQRRRHLLLDARSPPAGPIGFARIRPAPSTPP